MARQHDRPVTSESVDLFQSPGVVSVLQGTIHPLTQPDLNTSKVAGELCASHQLAAVGETCGPGPSAADAE